MAVFSHHSVETHKTNSLNPEVCSSRAPKKEFEWVGYRKRGGTMKGTRHQRSSGHPWTVCANVSVNVYISFKLTLIIISLADVRSRAKVNGTTRYFRAASTWNGRLCRLTWPGQPLVQLKAKFNQVRLSGTAYRFRWKLPWKTWRYHLLLPTTLVKICSSNALHHTPARLWEKIGAPRRNFEESGACRRRDPVWAVTETGFKLPPLRQTPTPRRQTHDNPLLNLQPAPHQLHSTKPPQVHTHHIKLHRCSVCTLRCPPCSVFPPPPLSPSLSRSALWWHNPHRSQTDTDHSAGRLAAFLSGTVTSPTQASGRGDVTNQLFAREVRWSAVFRNGSSSAETGWFSRGQTGKY